MNTQAAVPAAPAPPASAPPSPTAAMDALLRAMVEMKASDLHLSAGSVPTVRHDGEIDAGARLPQRCRRATPSGCCCRSRRRAPARSSSGATTPTSPTRSPGLGRFRVQPVRRPQGHRAASSASSRSKILTAEELGLSPEILDLCRLPKGLVLVTGPTGSGKSTTLCALIDYINRTRTDHIITIEDPLEFVHENKKCLVNQRQVGEHTDSFKDALRAALREDPDVVLVGEMRDLETMAIAIETAETGHLVFGTLHTSSAHGTVDRIINQFPADRQQQIRMMLADGLKGVISQMLCKKIGGGRVPALEVMIAHAVDLEPDPRGQDLPDPVDHAVGQEARHVPDERQLPGPGEEAADPARGRLRQGGRQGGPARPVQAQRRRCLVGAEGRAGAGARTAGLAARSGGA